jgi:hypothetical protein
MTDFMTSRRLRFTPLLAAAALASLGAAACDTAGPRPSPIAANPVVKTAALVGRWGKTFDNKDRIFISFAADGSFVRELVRKTETETLVERQEATYEASLAPNQPPNGTTGEGRIHRGASTCPEAFEGPFTFTKVLENVILEFQDKPSLLLGLATHLDPAPPTARPGCFRGEVFIPQ